MENVKFNAVKEGGYKLISANGNVTYFDKDGEILNNKIPKEYEQYFFKMGEKERIFVLEWYKMQKIKMPSQYKFFALLEEALMSIKYDYYIATVEPSINKENKLYYEYGDKVASSMNYSEWRRLAVEFAPEHRSRLATKYELIYWYAYRVAKGYWSLNYIIRDSSKLGNYKDTIDSSKKIEVSGERMVGGFNDGVGNTMKIVQADIPIVPIFGGAWNSEGKRNPVMSQKTLCDIEVTIENASAVLVLL